MEFHPLPILAFLTLVLAASHAAQAPELYWKTMLPNTPIPKAVRDSLQPDKSTTVKVGKGGVKPSGANVNFIGGKGVRVNTENPDAKKNYKRRYSQTHYDNVGKGGVKPSGANVNFIGGKGVQVNTENPDAKKNYKKRYSKKHYDNVGHAANKDKLGADSDATLFFLEKDMNTGTTMNLHFIKNSNMATFLPRQVAKSIPFSSDKLPEILNQFSMKPGSPEAEIIADTIKECEEPPMKGEDKYCATSLESMIDFSTSKLGKNLQAISTEVEKQTQVQKYTVADGGKKMGDKTVVCHKENYPYAVFYCHFIIQTKAYMVPLEGADGTKTKAVAVCHTDTSEWSPEHLAFQELKVKPGTVPICHFISEGNIVWVTN